MNQSNQKIIGLIAGSTQFPLLFARAARDQGYRVVAGAVKGNTSWLLPIFVDKTQWFAPNEFNKLMQYFQCEHVTQVLMAGKIDPQNLVDGKYPMDEDWRAIFEAAQDRKTDSVLAAVADKLTEYNMTLLDSTTLLEKYLSPKGTLTSRPPTETELNDITFGIDLAKQMGAMDIGQTVVVKEKGVIAVEAMEGTDRCIERGGRLAGGGAVVVKQSKPNQDNRFDVPVIGPNTITIMKRARCACLAIEAGKTLIIDFDKTVATANKAGICIVAA